MATRSQRSASPVFTDRKAKADAERYARQTICSMASHLAIAAQNTPIDLADEAFVEVFLLKQGWAESAVDAYLPDAIERARGIIARGRLAGFVGDAIAAALILGGGLLAYGLMTFEAHAGTAGLGRVSGWTAAAWIGGAVIVFVLVCAASCIRLSGKVSDDEERRDPVNYRRS